MIYIDDYEIRDPDGSVFCHVYADNPQELVELVRKIGGDPSTSIFQRGSYREHVRALVSHRDAWIQSGAVPHTMIERQMHLHELKKSGWRTPQ